MRKVTLIAILSLICIAFLLSACSSSAPVSPATTTPALQEQTPVTSVPIETQPITSAPSESTIAQSEAEQIAKATESYNVTVAEQTPTVTGVTASELALHNSKSDCWVVYKNTTYDVTKYLPKHPGGTLAINKHCGTLNFEKAFKGQHGTSKEKTLASNSINMGEYIG